MKKNMIWLVLGMVMLGGAPLLFGASRKKLRSASSHKARMGDGVNKQLRRLRALQGERDLNEAENSDDLVFLASQVRAAKALVNQATSKIKQKENELAQAQIEEKAAKSYYLKAADKAAQMAAKAKNAANQEAQAAAQAALARHQSALLNRQKIQQKIETLNTVVSEAAKEEQYWAEQITIVKKARVINTTDEID